MNSSDIPYEIERKFLIRYPEKSFIESAGDISSIEQTYLTASEGCGSERVRKRVRGDSCVYTHTCKKHINNMRRLELEEEISLEEYNELLKRADSERSVIKKQRICYNYKDQMFEIDLYPFWSDRAVMELELKDETQQIDFPPEIEILRELTDDKRYTNASLARIIPCDEL